MIWGYNGGLHYLSLKTTALQIHPGNAGNCHLAKNKKRGARGGKLNGIDRIWCHFQKVKPCVNF